MNVVVHAAREYSGGALDHEPEEGVAGPGVGHDAHGGHGGAEADGQVAAGGVFMPRVVSTGGKINTFISILYLYNCVNCIVPVYFTIICGFSGILCTVGKYSTVPYRYRNCSVLRVIVRKAISSKFSLVPYVLIGPTNHSRLKHLKKGWIPSFFPWSDLFWSSSSSCHFLPVASSFFGTKCAVFLAQNHRFQKTLPLSVLTQHLLDFFCTSPLPNGVISSIYHNTISFQTVVPCAR